jgi:hypothetical protein
MILGFKTTFTDGTPTDFVEKILAGSKIHSLRKDPHDRWRKSTHIHMATGVRTDCYKQFNEGITQLETCKSTQRIFMTYDWCLEITLDGKYLEPRQIELLIKNDGLTKAQFLKWFFSDGCGEWSGKIIHWTDFKY